MKTGIILCICLFLSMGLMAQKSPLTIESYKLKNGMTIYLNEDQSQSKVYGMVAAKGGSKRDPKESTGIAHYLEHMLFLMTEM